MTIARGTLSAATPASDLRAAIEGILPGVGWSSVDSYTNAGGDSIHVWKNPAANNSAAQDFFVGLTVPTANTTTLAVGLAEAYDPVNHVATKFKLGASNNNVTVDTDGTGKTATARAFYPVVADAAGSPALAAPTIPATAGGTYTCIANKDAIGLWGGAAGSSGNPTTMIVGRQLPATSGSNENGLALIPIPANTYNASEPIAGGTRLPNTASGTSSPYYAWNYVTPPVEGFTSASDPLVSNNPRGARMYLAEGTRAAFRHYFGLGLLNIPVSSPASTDDLSITVNGVAKTYMYLGNNIWVDQAA